MVGLQDNAQKLRQWLADERARHIKALLLKVFPEEMIEYLVKNPKMGYVVAAGYGHYVREICDPGVIKFQLVYGDSRYSMVGGQFAGKVVAETTISMRGPVQ